MSDNPEISVFNMPPEWAPHARTWMMWPRRGEVWDDIRATQKNYTSVAHEIRDFEPVSMVVHPEDRAQAHSMLGSDIELLEHPIDDSWARDAGPCFLTNEAGERAGVCFEFNAWGQKYTPFDGDNSAAAAILEAAGVPAVHSDLIAEGGGVSVDGEGTILSTESCFPNANRNPDWSRDDIEQELLRKLGAKKLIWLPGNAEETETDGHVDGISVFVGSGAAIIQDPGPSHHHWHDIHAANIEAIEHQTDAQGREIRLFRLPDASEIQVDGADICDSYVNSYICNGAVIMPQYGIRQDGLVREILQEALSGREVISVPIWDIAIGGGGIHCITQQEPLGQRDAIK